MKPKRTKPRRDRAGAITGTLARIATANHERAHSPAKRRYSRKGVSAKALRKLAEGLNGHIHARQLNNHTGELTHDCTSFQSR